MPQKLPYEEFLKTFENAPRAAISLFIRNKQGEVFLTRRAIEPERGMWHLPGSFILKGEKQEACIKRILEIELGYTGAYSQSLMGIFDDTEKDPRGHSIDIIYTVEAPFDIPARTTSETEEANYFETLPENIGFNHKEVVHKLLEAVNT